MQHKAKTQKELKEQYKQIMTDHCTDEHGNFDKSWYQYHIGEAFVIGELSDGTLFTIEKPALQKDFCFDDSYNMEGALKQASHARTSTDYFKTKNMMQLTGMLANFQNLDTWHKAVRQASYKSDKLTDVFVRNDRLGDFSADTLLSDQDIQKVIEAYELAIQKQEKRIDTYLKKYGLEHVNSWTYWGER